MLFQKPLFFKCLKSAKIQGTYFKISALYFKIYGLYFLQQALCFFEHAKRDVATPFYVHEFAFQTIQKPIKTVKNTIESDKHGFFLK